MAASASLPDPALLFHALVPRMPLLLLVALLAVLAKRALLARAQRTRLPPGPKSSWFGAVQLPKEYQWLTYATWKKLYGDVIYIHIFGNPIIVLNSAEAVNDLFEKRSAIYSSRPARTMINELMGFDWLFSSMAYGPWWKKHRALFHQHFNSTNLPAVQPIVTRETYTLLRNLAQSPDQLFHHVKRSSAAIVMMMSYGHQIAPEGDMYVTIADKALAGLAQAGIWGTYLVDYMSFLKHVPSWLPGASFKRKAAEWRQMNRSMLNLPFDMVKQRMESNLPSETVVGTALPCFVANELERLFAVGGNAEEEKVIKDVAATVYAAGADTTVSATLSFFLATMMCPDIQTKAQAQIDEVIGHDRLPTFEDRESLPYIDCIVWECLRWNPVTPMGLARKVTEDDEYRGYKIPKNTTILPNVWAILHEEKMYPEPLRFNPDRFADEKQNTALGINELPLAAFGFGRRMCPGRWLAFETVWLTIATTLAAFNISKARDEQGNVIEPDTHYTPASLSRPKPFKCSIVPRSDKTLSLVHQAYDGA